VLLVRAKGVLIDLNQADDRLVLIGAGRLNDLGRLNRSFYFFITFLLVGLQTVEAFVYLNAILMQDGRLALAPHILEVCVSWNRLGITEVF